MSIGPLAAAIHTHPRQHAPVGSRPARTSRRADCIFQPEMVTVYSNPGHRSPAPGRLNLLLSSGGWRSEPWVESLPALMEPMGVRAWRAQTGQEAAQLIQQIPIHIAVVDLALPLDQADQEDEVEEGGARLLQLLDRLASPPPTIVVQRARSSRDHARELSQALSLGVFAVLHRPVQLEQMLDTFQRILRRHYQSRWPDGGELRETQ